MTSISDRSAPAFVRWTTAILAVYSAGLLVAPSPVLVSADESLYIEQAVEWAHGRGLIVSDYPPGTSLLQVPFVMAGGWQAAALASAVCLAATVVMLGRWLIALNYSPVAALLFLLYAPTLVLGRLGMSDVPSAAVITAGLWLLWTGAGRPWRSLAAGVLAGLTLLFRETNGLIAFPFVVGAVVRRQAASMWLALGAVAGIAVRLVLYQQLFASPLFFRSPEGWSPAAALDSLPIYAFALLVLVPGGLVALATYRGQRRAELATAVVLYLSAFVFFVYSGQSSQPLARLAAAGRYLIPLVPLVAVAWADMARRRAWPMHRLLPAAAAMGLTGALLVHPVIRWWGLREAPVVRDILAQVRPGDVLVAGAAERKYVSPVYGQHNRIWIEDLPVSELASVTRRHHGTFLVSLRRHDNQTRNVPEEPFVSMAKDTCRLEAVVDREYAHLGRLRLWHVASCNGEGP